MDWLEEYKNDIADLARVVASIFPENIDDIRQEIKGIFSPLDDDMLDPGDLEKIAEKWWEKFAEKEIEMAKKTIEIHMRLMGLYEYLSTAKEEEWERYAKTVSAAKLHGMKPLLRMTLAES